MGCLRCIWVQTACCSPGILKVLMKACFDLFHTVLWEASATKSYLLDLPFISRSQKFYKSFRFDLVDSRDKVCAYLFRTVWIGVCVFELYALILYTCCLAMTCLSMGVDGSWSLQLGCMMNMERWLWKMTAATTTAHTNLRERYHIYICSVLLV